jgi:UDP-glucuronate decarboxylase
MLGLAKRLGAKILQASTSEVYGDPPCTRRPKNTGATSTRSATRSCYDEGKRCAETLFFDYHRQHKLRIKVRASSTPTARACTRMTGAWCRTSSCRRCKGEDITIYGDGLQTRSFCYVDDLIEGMIRLMDTGDDVTGPINVGNPGEFTMIELAEAVLKLVGSKSKLVRQPLPADDPKQRKPDITQSQEYPGLGAEGSARGRPQGNDRLFPEAPERVTETHVALPHTARPSSTVDARRRPCPGGRRMGSIANLAAMSSR